jgi:hypothetical protein
LEANLVFFLLVLQISHVMLLIFIWIVCQMLSKLIFRDCRAYIVHTLIRWSVFCCQVVTSSLFPSVPVDVCRLSFVTWYRVLRYQTC